MNLVINKDIEKYRKDVWEWKDGQGAGFLGLDHWYGCSDHLSTDLLFSCAGKSSDICGYTILLFYSYMWIWEFWRYDIYGIFEKILAGGF